MKKISIMFVIFIYCIFGYAPALLYRNHPDVERMIIQFPSHMKRLFVVNDRNRIQANQHKRSCHKIVDKATGISIQGDFNRDVSLTVRRENVLANTKSNNGILVRGYRLHLNGRYQGEIHVSFPIGMENEGQPIKVQVLKENQVIHTYKTIVKNGSVNIRVHELSTFKIYMDHYNRYSFTHGSLVIICIGAIILCLITMNCLLIMEGRKERRGKKKK